MLTVRPGDVIYSSWHKRPLYVCGRNGGRPWQYLGWELRNGKPDKDSLRIFTAEDVAAIQTPDGMQQVLPGTVAMMY